MRLTDWRGNEYGVGDTIIYPRQAGHSVEVKEGVVLDIANYHRDDDWNWQRVPEGHASVSGRTETRVKVQPSRSSRFTYWGEVYKPAVITNIKNITLMEAS